MKLLAIRGLRWILRFLPLAYMGFIWYLSGKPSDMINSGLPYDAVMKEALHLLEFAALYGFLVLALLTFGKLSPKTSRLAALASIAYGFMDELHQFFIPFRSATPVDLFKDTIGVLVVWYLFDRLYFHHENSRLGLLLHRFGEMLGPAGLKGRNN